MSLIINGIDFDKRLDDAKRQLHEEIQWIWLTHKTISIFRDTGMLLKFTNDDIIDLPSSHEIRESLKQMYVRPEKNPESIPEWIRRKGREVQHRDDFIPLITS